MRYASVFCVNAFWEQATAAEWIAAKAKVYRIL